MALLAVLRTAIARVPRKAAALRQMALGQTCSPVPSPCASSSLWYSRWLCAFVHRTHTAGEAAVRKHDRHSRCRLQRQQPPPPPPQQQPPQLRRAAASFSTGPQRGSAYATFGLRPGASFEDIQKQFRKQVGGWAGRISRPFPAILGEAAILCHARSPKLPRPCALTHLLVPSCRVTARDFSAIISSSVPRSAKPKHAIAHAGAAAAPGHQQGHVSRAGRRSLQAPSAGVRAAQTRVRSVQGGRCWRESRRLRQQVRITNTMRESMRSGSRSAAIFKANTFAPHDDLLSPLAMTVATRTSTTTNSTSATA
jgi:hypothetical protein